MKKCIPKHKALRTRSRVSADEPTGLLGDCHKLRTAPGSNRFNFGQRACGCHGHANCHSGFAVRCFTDQDKIVAL